MNMNIFTTYMTKGNLFIIQIILKVGNKITNT